MEVRVLMIHIHIYLPSRAVVETAEAWAQAECDPEMALRTLDTKVQGFPER